MSELGASAFSYKDEKGVIHYPEIDLVRIAISRRVYTNSHMDVIADALGELSVNADLLTLRVWINPIGMGQQLTLPAATCPSSSKFLKPVSAL